MQKTKRKYLIAFFIIGIVSIIVALNKWVGWQINSLGSSTINVKKSTIKSSQGAPALHGQVIRKMRLDANRKFSENIFYIGDQEIARFKNTGDEIFDYTGKIPDGKVNFVNEITNTYGSEYYINAKRDGKYTEYYPDGVVFQEISYRNGKIKKHSVYYVDGTLKKEVDFEDSLLFMKDKEVGTGKKYTRDGILKYEWHITNMDENRFKRSYNIKGKLVEEKLFDNMGNLIEVKTPNS